MWASNRAGGSPGEAVLEKISQLQQTALEGWLDRYRIDLIKPSQNSAVIAD